MARLPYLDKQDVAPEFRDVLDRPINLNRILVHSPKCRRLMLGLARYIRYESKLDPRLRELAILQVGYLARAPYEWSHHIKIGHEFGVTDQDIENLIASSEGRPATMDPLTDAVLRAAREMTTVLAISQGVFDLLKKHLSSEQLVDLVVTIAQYNATVRILATLEIDVEPEYMPYLERFPLPA